MRLARPVLLLALAASLTACGGGGAAEQGTGSCAEPHASAPAVEAGHVVRTVPARDPRELATLSPDQASLVEQLAAAEAAHAAGEVSGGSEHRALASGGGGGDDKHDKPAATCAPATKPEKKKTAGH